ncbi:hypothetical protein XENORESO_017547 [Xenotaenia resolanae]|uniref:Zinc-ribbon domain-containing protein n=1 Tax=Xenotaenia resolanae TaxID=208358 RepID=A0ABV0VSW3_9TELE
MNCPSCGKELVELSPSFCSSCGKRIQEICVGATPRPSTRQAVPPCPTPAFSTFLEYRQKKNEERQKFSLGRKGLEIKVGINVGLMVIQKGWSKATAWKNYFPYNRPRYLCHNSAQSGC